MITVVTEPSQVAHARRLVTEFALQAGLPEKRVGNLAIVVTELATNLIKPAGCGEILASCFDDADGSGIEILSLDRGPGMKDIAACMRDGFSTAGSLGQGLGSVARQSDQFRVYSRPGLGTIASARLVIRPAVPETTLQCGAAVMPYPGETDCGDGWAWARTPSGPTLFMADGSGHGLEANRAARIGIQLFMDHAGDSFDELGMRLHSGLMPTRGAAIAIARFDHAAGAVRYLGIGNINGLLLTGGQSNHMVSHNGVAGHVAPRMREFVYPYAGAALVILHSDGLTSRWDLTSYPGIAAQHPSLLTGVLLRDFRRGRDDASVVAMRIVA